MVLELPSSVSAVAGTPAPAASFRFAPEPTPAPTRITTSKVSPRAESISALLRAGEEESDPATTNAASTLEAAVAEMQNTMERTSTNLRFEVDAGTGRTVIKVLDGRSGELLRQIPSEEVLALSASVARMTGVVVDQQL